MLQPALPEIAFVGRSNVGKSSLLNALVGRRALARVSSTPGKTQHVNVFQLPTFYLIDLPGYGWARASATDRRSFRQLLETYLKRRERLAGIVWLLDIRHSPSLDDQEVHAVLVETGRPTLVALTKGDKLPQER
ncbi:MAG: ribosome biogenesis GTP-binding protein YihA/YsxC, partial [Gemmatimonadota bacterium]